MLSSNQNLKRHESSAYNIEDTPNDIMSEDMDNEPPRKRRAAAVAAQKNWQMLNKPDEEDINLDEDIIIINQKKDYSKPTEKKTNNITISPQNSNNSLSSLKKISIPNTIIIDLSPNKLNKRKSRNYDIIDDNNDCDYNPYKDLMNSKKDNRYTKKTTISPYRKTVNNTVIGSNHPIISSHLNSVNNINIINTNINRSQTSIRNKNSADIICIDSQDIPRIIKRTNANSYRRPNVIKLHPNEPQVLPIFDENVEEIVGTYIEDEEEYNVKQSDETTDNLELEVVCIDKNCDQNIECVEDAEIVIEEVKETTPKIVQQNRHLINFNRREKLKNYKNCYFDEIIGSLEMNCENFDDDFTDNICFDCEDDLLNSQQWNETISSKKEYDNYANVIKSSKNVKFLPESEVKEPVGVITTTISETSRTITHPKPTPAPIRNRIQNTDLSQSVNSPIPSTLNRINLLNSQRPQRMIPSMPIQSPSMNGTIILPVSSGISTPLLLSSQNVMTSNVPSIPAGVQVILSQGPQNQTFIMYPKTTNCNTIPTNTMLGTNSPQTVFSMTPNLYLPNQNATVMRQNLVNTNASYPNMIYTSQSQTRIRAPTPTSASQPHYLRVVRTPGSINITRPTTQSPRLPSVNTYSSNANQNHSITNHNLLRNVLNSDNTQKPDNTSVTNPLFDCLTSVKGNLTKKVNMRTLLTIKPLPFSWPSNIDDLINSLIKLDNALMKEKFKESPIAWMVNALLICPPKCSVCQKGLCNQVNRTRDAKNEYWMCNNSRCQNTFPIERPLIFSGPQFDIPVSKLLFIIYYWSIQVDVEDLIKTGQIEMGTDIIYNIWQKLQRVCSLALQTKDSMLGSNSKSVDVASVQIGRFYVIGAMESGSHRCKLCVVSLTNLVQQNGKDFIIKPILRWIEKGTQIRTCEKKFMSLREIGYRVQVLTKSEFLCSNKNLSLTNIGGYLIHHLQRLFKDFDVSTLTHDILNNVLEELLWRERYGTNPFSAFYNIIKHIAEQCGIRKPEQLSQNIQIPIAAPNRASNLTPIRTTPVVVPHRPVGRPRNDSSNSNNNNNNNNNSINNNSQQIMDPNSIFVDEYYYSSLKLKSSFAKRNPQEEDLPKDSIQCHLCQMFFDNILIIKHLLEHLEKERRGRVRKGDNNELECKHCLRFFTNRTLHMHDELANLKLIPYSCRICSLPFYARNPFILHMKTSHFSGEMPYYCDICSYRSSFQKNLMDHFEATHSSVGSVMCPFCVRIFNLSKFKNLSQFFYRHLATHYAVASVYDCDKCVLTFTTKGDLREHCFKGHNPSNAIDEKFDLIPYLVEQEEMALCVRALEQELFTPNLPTFGNMEYLENDETQNTDNNEVDCSLLVSCDPFASDFSIEPEIQISINENNTTLENFILPVDCEYTNEQLDKMLSQSFDISEEIDAGQQVIVLPNNKTTKCYECQTYLNISHYMKKGVCLKCNYVTHCKKAFTEHMIAIHSTDENRNSSYKSTTVLRDFPSFNCYNIICNDCKFTTKDGNQMALHMIRFNHFSPICKSLTPTPEPTQKPIELIE